MLLFPPPQFYYFPSSSSSSLLLFSLLLLLLILIVFPFPPHFDCFDRVDVGSKWGRCGVDVGSLLFSLLLLISIVFPPPPLHFYCFASSFSSSFLLFSLLLLLTLLTESLRSFLDRSGKRKRLCRHLQVPWSADHPAFWMGQHSLISVERSSHLRSDFVNVWRHARRDSSALRSSVSDLFDFWWKILSHFLDHSSIDSNQFKQEDATASVWRMFWCFKPLLTPRRKGSFSGCYWITAFEWPQITRLCI